MPFDFLKRKGPSAGAAGTAADGLTGVGTRGVPFDGLTEEWRIIGTMEISGRLSDVLNKREVIAISDVQWTPIEVEEPFTPAPGLKSIDPYDLIIVMAGAATQPPLTESQRAAYKVHKVGLTSPSRRLRSGCSARSTCIRDRNRAGSWTAARRCSSPSWTPPPSSATGPSLPPRRRS